MTNSDKLTEILESVTAEQGRYWAGKDHYLPDTKFMTVDQGKSAIIKLFNKLVPKKNNLPAADAYEGCENSGFNDCRTLILKNIGRLRK